MFFMHVASSNWFAVCLVYQMNGILFVYSWVCRFAMFVNINCVKLILICLNLILINFYQVVQDGHVPFYSLRLRACGY